MCDQRERARTESRTDACPKSSSTARNSAPIGLGNVDHQRQLQILAASLPLAPVSLRARPRTVGRTAVADMEVTTGAHVHVQGLKMLTFCPCMRPAIKHVDPWAESLASPLHALSPSSSSTLEELRSSRTFFEILSLRTRECQQGGGRNDAVFTFGHRVQDLDIAILDKCFYKRTCPDRRVYGKMAFEPVLLMSKSCPKVIP